jgi:hypothetical protein
MKYQGKPELIEANQMAKEAGSNSLELPLWITAAWSEDDKALVPLYSTEDGTISISMRDWQRVVSWGDEVFRKTREEVPNERKPVAWRYTDSFGTHFTEDSKDILDTPGIESWTALYSEE